MADQGDTVEFVSIPLGGGRRKRGLLIEDPSLNQPITSTTTTTTTSQQQQSSAASAGSHAAGSTTTTTTTTTSSSVSPALAPFIAERFNALSVIEPKQQGVYDTWCVVPRSNYGSAFQSIVSHCDTFYRFDDTQFPVGPDTLEKKHLGVKIPAEVVLEFRFGHSFVSNENNNNNDNTSSSGGGGEQANKQQSSSTSSNTTTSYEYFVTRAFICEKIHRNQIILHSTLRKLLNVEVSKDPHPHSTKPSSGSSNTSSPQVVSSTASGNNPNVSNTNTTTKSSGSSNNNSGNTKVDVRLVKNIQSEEFLQKHELAYVELSFSGAYVSVADTYVIAKGLTGACLTAGMSLSLDMFQCQVSRLLKINRNHHSFSSSSSTNTNQSSTTNATTTPRGTFLHSQQQSFSSTQQTPRSTVSSNNSRDSPSDTPPRPSSTQQPQQQQHSSSNLNVWSYETGKEYPMVVEDSSVFINSFLTPSQQQQQNTSSNNNSTSNSQEPYFSVGNGFVTERTKIVFSSGAAVATCILIISSEMGRIMHDGRTAMEWAVDGFMRTYVARAAARSKAVEPFLRILLTGTTKESMQPYFHCCILATDNLTLLPGQIRRQMMLFVERATKHEYKTRIEPIQKAAAAVAAAASNVNNNNENATETNQKKKNKKKSTKKTSSTNKPSSPIHFNFNNDHDDDPETFFSSSSGPYSTQNPFEAFTPAIDSNMLYALNIAIETISIPHINRRLKLTGDSIIVITAGNCVFRAQFSMSQATARRLVDTGIRMCQLVAIGRPPFHVTPLLEFQGADEELQRCRNSARELDRDKSHYEQPPWLRQFFFDAPRIPSGFFHSPVFRLFTREQWFEQLGAFSSSPGSLGNETLSTSTSTSGIESIPRFLLSSSPTSSSSKSQQQQQILYSMFSSKNSTSSSSPSMMKKLSQQQISSSSLNSNSNINNKHWMNFSDPWIPYVHNSVDLMLNPIRDSTSNLIGASSQGGGVIIGNQKLSGYSTGRATGGSGSGGGDRSGTANSGSGGTGRHSQCDSASMTPRFGVGGGGGNSAPNSSHSDPNSGNNFYQQQQQQLVRGNALVPASQHQHYRTSSNPNFSSSSNINIRGGGGTTTTRPRRVGLNPNRHMRAASLATPTNATTTGGGGSSFDHNQVYTNEGLGGTSATSGIGGGSHSFFHDLGPRTFIECFWTETDPHRSHQGRGAISMPSSMQRRGGSAGVGVGATSALQQYYSQHQQQSQSQSQSQQQLYLPPGEDSLGNVSAGSSGGFSAYYQYQQSSNKTNKRPGLGLPLHQLTGHHHNTGGASPTMNPNATTNVNAIIGFGSSSSLHHVPPHERSFSSPSSSIAPIVASPFVTASSSNNPNINMMNQQQQQQLQQQQNQYGFVNNNSFNSPPVLVNPPSSSLTLPDGSSGGNDSSSDNILGISVAEETFFRGGLTLVMTLRRTDFATDEPIPISWHRKLKRSDDIGLDLWARFVDALLEAESKPRTSFFPSKNYPNSSSSPNNNNSSYGYSGSQQQQNNTNMNNNNNIETVSVDTPASDISARNSSLAMQYFVGALINAGPNCARIYSSDDVSAGNTLSITLPRMAATEIDPNQLTATKVWFVPNPSFFEKSSNFTIAPEISEEDVYIEPTTVLEVVPEAGKMSLFDPANIFQVPELAGQIALQQQLQQYLMFSSQQQQQQQQSSNVGSSSSQEQQQNISNEQNVSSSHHHPSGFTSSFASQSHHHQHHHPSSTTSQNTSQQQQLLQKLLPQNANSKGTGEFFSQRFKYGFPQTRTLGNTWDLLFQSPLYPVYCPREMREHMLRGRKNFQGSLPKYTIAVDSHLWKPEELLHELIQQRLQQDFQISDEPDRNENNYVVLTMGHLTHILQVVGGTKIEVICHYVKGMYPPPSQASRLAKSCSFSFWKWNYLRGRWELRFAQLDPHLAVRRDARQYNNIHNMASPALASSTTSTQQGSNFDPYSSPLYGGGIGSSLSPTSLQAHTSAARGSNIGQQQQVSHHQSHQNNPNANNTSFAFDTMTNTSSSVATRFLNTSSASHHHQQMLLNQQQQHTPMIEQIHDRWMNLDNAIAGGPGTLIRASRYSSCCFNAFVVLPPVSVVYPLQQQSENYYGISGNSSSSSSCYYAPFTASSFPSVGSFNNESDQYNNNNNNNMNRKPMYCPGEISAEEIQTKVKERFSPLLILSSNQSQPQLPINSTSFVVDWADDFTEDTMTEEMPLMHTFRMEQAPERVFYRREHDPKTGVLLPAGHHIRERRNICHIETSTYVSPFASFRLNIGWFSCASSLIQNWIEGFRNISGIRVVQLPIQRETPLGDVELLPWVSLKIDTKAKRLCYFFLLLAAGYIPESLKFTALSRMVHWSGRCFVVSSKEGLAWFENRFVDLGSQESVEDFRVFKNKIGGCAADVWSRDPVFVTEWYNKLCSGTNTSSSSSSTNTNTNTNAKQQSQQQTPSSSSKQFCCPRCSKLLNQSLADFGLRHLFSCQDKEVIRLRKKHFFPTTSSEQQHQQQQQKEKEKRGTSPSNESNNTPASASASASASENLSSQQNQQRKFSPQLSCVSENTPILTAVDSLLNTPTAKSKKNISVSKLNDIQQQQLPEAAVATSTATNTNITTPPSSAASTTLAMNDSNLTPLQVVVSSSSPNLSVHHASNLSVGSNNNNNANTVSLQQSPSEQQQRQQSNISNDNDNEEEKEKVEKEKETQQQEAEREKERLKLQQEAETEKKEQEKREKQEQEEREERELQKVPPVPFSVIWEKPQLAVSYTRDFLKMPPE